MTGKVLRKVIVACGFGIVLLIVFLLIVRKPMLNWAIGKAESEFMQRFGATLKIGEAGFTGLSSVALKDISLTPATGDTLIIADTLNVRVSILPIITGTIKIKELFASGINLRIHCIDSVCNFQNLIHSSSKPKKVSNEKSDVKSKSNFAQLIKGMLDRAFNFAPQLAVMKDVSFEFRNDTLQHRVTINEFHSDEDQIYGMATDIKNNTIWYCSGTFSQDDHAINLNVYSAENNRSLLPLADELLGLSVGFDTATVSIDGYEGSRNLLKARGKLSIRNLKTFHKRLSDDTIRVESASIQYFFNAGPSFMEIDSNSLATLTHIRFNPYIRYSNDGRKEYSLNLKTEKINSTDFFSSLPEGMFDEVRSIKADGAIQYSLVFKINDANPDSVIFDSSIKKEKFRIKSFGSTGLMKMGGEFTHDVYERGRLIRVFQVGPSNPDYTPLDSISHYFVDAVLTSEDGNFFFHNGFNEDAFRKSIVTNFKAKKFVRGGSTISMQLVKNVFLNRKKTIARKAEEALIVWLIESNRLYSKERMLEVYMNIIELGPNVYGVKEASRFYFAKQPYELDLAEGIFLAHLLPHPKWVKSSFDTLGNLKPYLADYYRIVSDFMLRRNLITQEERDKLVPNVTLRGPAKEFILPETVEPEDPGTLKNRILNFFGFGKSD